jgi:hypothetical protein
VRDHGLVGNYLDFLVVLDDHIAGSSLGYITYGHEMHGIARAAGLVEQGDESAARWVGELVQLGYLTHGPLGLGDRQPLPRGAYVSSDLSRVSDYRITYEGRTEADRVRRQRREALSDSAIGGVLPSLLRPWMSELERNAIIVPLGHLRSALDSEQFAAAVGAAKDLVEAACKLAISREGGIAPSAAGLPALFKQALGNSAAAKEQADVGRSLIATVQRIAELRNAVGAGHGRATQPEISPAAARLAATAATGIAVFLLGPQT